MALSTKREAFRVDTIARGLDLTRTTYLKAYGNYVANSATTFEAGMPVSLNAAGEIIVHAGADTRPFGVAKYNKDTTISAAISAEPIQFAIAGGTATLAHTGLIDHGGANTGGLRITAAATGGVSYVETTDFTYVSATGVVTHVPAPGGSIPLLTTVYAWYQYNLTAAELLRDGLNFWNFSDDITVQGGKCVVITGPCEIYTTQYNAARTWAINDDVTIGAVGDGANGIYDQNSTSANNTSIGRVIQLPTADDPYLGIQLY